MSMAHTPSSEIVRVMIVDDHEIVRRGIAEIIDRADGLDVVAEAGSRAEAVRRAELVRPDVILVDLQLPDGTGIELMQELRESVPQALPIVLTSFDDDEALAEALAAGARAYLLKTSTAPRSATSCGPSPPVASCSTSAPSHAAGPTTMTPPRT